MNKLNWYKDKVCLNVLAKDLNNAIDIYKETEGYSAIGILSKSFSTVELAVKEMKKWAEKLDNNISVGLGAGDPKQSFMVAEIVKKINPNHVNQVFTGVGLSVDDLKSKTSFINCLVSPTGKPGYVKVSTGPLSSLQEDGVIPIRTAIQMIKDMGGDSIKFFPMNGLETKNEYIEVAKACAELDFGLEPTGGIDLKNFEEILKIAVDHKVKKIIPHVYSSIIDSKTGLTNIADIKTIMDIIKKVVN